MICVEIDSSESGERTEGGEEGMCFNLHERRG